MVKLEDEMTLPSGRKLKFDADYRDVKCRLLSCNDGFIDEGIGNSRVDALGNLYLELLLKDANSEPTPRHARYRARMRSEVKGLWNEARLGIPQPQPKPHKSADPWEVVR